MNSSVNAHRYSKNKFNVDAGSYEYAIDMHIYDNSINAVPETALNWSVMSVRTNTTAKSMPTV